MQSVTMSALFICLTAASQAPSEREVVAALHPHYAREAGYYKLLGPGDKPLQLANKPVMTWTAEGGWTGDLFVWTYNHRPMMIGCIGSSPLPTGERGVFHEFHWLSERQPPRIETKIGRPWTIDAATPRPIPNAPTVASTHSGRLIQMRSLVRRFSYTMESKEKDKHQLRLLSRPIFRSPNSEARQDSALFAYVWDRGTDPEALILIESVLVDGRAEWFYVPARFTHRALWLSLAGTEVYQVESFNGWDVDHFRGPYVSYNVDPVSVEALVKNARVEEGTISE